MNAKRLTLEQLHQEMEVIEVGNLRTIKGGTGQDDIQWGQDYDGNLYWRMGDNDVWQRYVINLKEIVVTPSGQDNRVLPYIGGGSYGLGSSNGGGNEYNGGGGGNGSGGTLTSAQRNLSPAALITLGLTSAEFATTLSAALLPFAEILIPVGIVGYITYAIYDAQSSIYSYDRGLPFIEPPNPYNNQDGGMNPFPNGDDFSNAIKAALIAVGLGSLFDEMKDYFGWGTTPPGTPPGTPPDDGGSNNPKDPNDPD